MLFNSVAFMVFLPIVFILYWSIPGKYRWVLLFVSSYYFYMSWNIKYVVLILFTTMISYCAARFIEKCAANFVRKLILYGTVIACLGVLFFFKYYDFFSTNVVEFFELFAIRLHPVTLNLLLPVGISFYTFQTLSYVVDVYRGEVKAEKHFGIYATFISFFPQLVAGPIERTKNLLPQIKKIHQFDYDRATYGLKLMTWGFFKKLVIADVLAVYVDRIYNNPYNFTGFSLILATLFFSIQIYCDFSGYSDIAKGTANLMGIDLVYNFKSPYFSSSIKEFWSRWHISLSTWFRDYVYIPLGGNRGSKIRRNRNLLITFLVSGLWHGANWTFLIWGGVHGLAQIFENIFKVHRSHDVNKLEIWASRLCIFVFCSFAWIFFRANTITDVGYIISHALNGVTSLFQYLKMGFIDIGMDEKDLILVMMNIMLLFIYDWFSMKTDVIKWISSKRLAVRYSCYFGLLIIIMLFKASGEATFVYFQF